MTRRRVFAKFIDEINFPENDKETIREAAFAPDPNQQFDPDIYYVDRKSLENKSMIEFELGTIMDIEGLKLPGRVCNARRCPFQYRGEGCLYEYNENREENVHGYVGQARLPKEAPPRANSKDELITTILGVSQLGDRGEYELNTTYDKGQFVWIKKDNIRYYFVASTNNVTVSPPNPIFWIEDACSKLIRGCNIRYDTIDDGVLNFGGFPGILSQIG